MEPSTHSELSAGSIISRNDSQNVQSQAPTAVKSTFPDVVTDSGAVFIQATEHILPGVALTAGVRYTEERKRFNANFLAYLTPAASRSRAFLSLPR